MRQILIGACIVFSCSVIAACNGPEFARGESPSDDDQSPTGAKNPVGSGGRSSAGTSSSGGSSPGGGKMQTGGGTTTVTPSGGSPSAGGGTVTGGGDECAEGSITIRMVPGPDLPHDYLCDAGCGTGWLTITDAEGASAFTIFSACGTASCESCEILPCAAAACLPTPLTAEGSKLTWTGTHLAQDKCGEQMACQRQTCVPPGKYRAKACAAVSAGSNDVAGGCVPKDGIMLCSEAEFDFPSSNELVLELRKP